MKYSIELIQQGLASFLDNELLPQVVTKGKPLSEFALATICTLAIRNLPIKVKELAQNPLTSYLGIIDESGAIDIDILAESAKKVMPSEGLKLNLPTLPIITFKTEDIDILLEYIKREH